MNGTALFAKLSNTLITAVTTQAFAMTVRNVSTAFGAAATQYVGFVNLTVSAVTITSEADDDVKSHDGGLTRGGVIGVAVGAVVFSALLLVCLYFAASAVKQQIVEKKVSPENSERRYPLPTGAEQSHMSVAQIKHESAL